MSTLKKAISCILSASLILVMLSACGSNASAPSTTPAPGAAAGTPSGADDTVYHLKIASSAIDNHGDFMTKTFIELIEERSEGRITTDYYPNMQMGSIREYYDACQNGQIQLAEGGGAVMANFTEKMGFMNLPMMFDSSKSVQEFMNSDVGQQLIIDIAEETNLYLLVVCENGFQAISNNKREIHSPSDIKGMKVRTQENPVIMKIYETLGAIPTPMAYSELFTALQQGTVDAQVNPALVMATTKIYEVQKYISDTNLMYDTVTFAMNYDYFKALPKDLQELAVECAQEAWAAELEYCAQDSLTFLEENGMTVTRLTEDERAAFETAVEPVYDWFRKTYNEPNLDTYLAAIEEANAATQVAK